ncbi:glycosyltransferase [Rahnella sp. PCH160]|uniref:glycosyltransferase n=1 Tax=Rahnella sp. PCH160 TaxID=3447928 RepID=UPI0039FD8098
MIQTVKPKIAVLFAAYNGIDWLSEQIESILNQSDVQITIFISVDLSTDSTYEACQELSQVYDNIEILKYGARFGGAGKNFLRLFVDVDFTGFDYISLADQDDIWLPTKLIDAINALNANTCDGYSSNVTAFWPDGKTCLIDKAQKQVAYDFFFEPAGPGCTYVLTNRLANQFKHFVQENRHDAELVVAHDWLIYAYARFNNYGWYIDKKPSMLYRQHANNQVGANVNLTAYFKRLKLVKSKWYQGEVFKVINVLGAKSHPFIKKNLVKGQVNYNGLALSAFKCRRRLRDKCALLILCIVHLF